MVPIRAMGPRSPLARVLDGDGDWWQTTVSNQTGSGEIKVKDTPLTSEWLILPDDRRRTGRMKMGAYMESRRQINIHRFVVAESRRDSTHNKRRLCCSRDRQKRAGKWYFDVLIGSGCSSGSAFQIGLMRATASIQGGVGNSGGGVSYDLRGYTYLSGAYGYMGITATAGMLLVLHGIV